jgi:hypothetical protein
LRELSSLGLRDNTVHFVILMHADMSPRVPAVPEFWRTSPPLVGRRRKYLGETSRIGGIPTHSERQCPRTISPEALRKICDAAREWGRRLGEDTEWLGGSEVPEVLIDELVHLDLA